MGGRRVDVARVAVVMSAFSPKSTAALILEREQHGQVQQLLAGRFTGARVVQTTQLSDDVLEALFTVPYGYPSPRRCAKTAWICRASSSVQIMDGWNVL